jgi:4-hydroxybenzoate polyprenyltransferase
MVVGLVRMVHPFPSLLDAVVTGVIVLIAGGAPAVAARLGVAMFAMQAAIGTANDLVDEPLDRGRKTGKPLPRGLVGRRLATAVFAGSLTIGLLLSAQSRAAVLAVAVAGVAVGLAYDLRLKRTAWSWLPFAIGIPLLPAYAWLGAAGELPPGFLVLLPLAAVAGAAVAMANALADVERDRSAGILTVATKLGARRTWLAGAILHLVVIVVALASLLAFGGDGAGALVVGLGGSTVGVGLAVARGNSAPARERGWEIQAVGLAVVAAGWLGGLVRTPAL